MQFLIIIISAISIFAFAYLGGLISVWLYEIKMRKMFLRMQEKIRQLESEKFSAALFHVKEYKITEDYRQEMLEIEKVQKFILKKLLLARTPNKDCFKNASFF